MVKAIHKQTRQQAAANSFEAVAREWHGKSCRGGLRPQPKDIAIIGKGYVSLAWGASIKDIAAPELLATFRRVESRGALELAHRIREMAGHGISLRCSHRKS